MSYVFGVLAGLMLLNFDRTTTSAWISEFGRYLGFAALTLLTAFSKEDMAPFLGLTATWSAILVHHRTQSLKPALLHLATALAIISLCYAASILHSSLSNSPVISGEGVYKLSEPLRNVATNLAFYLSMHQASRLLFLIFALAAAALSVSSIRIPELRPVAFRLIFVIACSLP